MGSQDEIIKVVMKVEGQAELEALRAKAGSFEKQIVDLGTTMRAMGAGPEAIRRATAAVGEQLIATQKEIKRTEDSLRGLGGINGGKAVQFFTQLGYVADDAQYGLQGVTNNLIGMMAPLGAWGTVIGVGATGLAVFAQHSRTLTSVFRTDLFDQGANAVKRMTKEMEALQKETLLTAGKMRKLGVLQEELANRKLQQAGLAAEQPSVKGVRAAYNQAVEGGGYGQIESAALLAARQEWNGPEGMNGDDRIRHHLGKIVEAHDAGTMILDRGKNEGKAVARVDQNRYMNDSNYRASYDSAYQTSALLSRQRQIVGRIGNEGSVDELTRLQEALGKTNLYKIDEEGRTTDASGRVEHKGLSTLFGAGELAANTRARRAEAKKDQDDAFNKDRDDAAAMFKNQIALGALTGKGDEEMLPKLIDQGKASGKDFIPDAVKDAVQKVRDQVRDEINSLMAEQGLDRGEAKGMVEKKYRDQFNAKRNADGARWEKEHSEITEGNAKSAEEFRKQQEKLLPATGLQDEALGLIGAVRARKLRKGAKVPERGRFDEKNAKDNGRIDLMIQRAAYRNLLEQGVPQGEAERQASAAPQYFRDLYQKNLDGLMARRAVNPIGQKDLRPAGQRAADPRGLDRVPDTGLVQKATTPKGKPLKMRNGIPLHVPKLQEVSPKKSAEENAKAVAENTKMLGEMGKSITNLADMLAGGIRTLAVMGP